MVKMSVAEQIALQNAAAFSATEGLPLEQRHIEIIHGTPEGKVNLHEYLQSLQNGKANGILNKAVGIDVNHFE